VPGERRQVLEGVSRGGGHRVAGEAPTPSVTVVIPTRNRAASLEALLRSLAAVGLAGPSFEVVVVNNNSTDQTDQVARHYVNRGGLRVRYVCETEPGLHAGRHRGADEAAGSVLAYLDDDTIVDSAWLRGAEPILAGEADAVVSRILPSWESPPPAWLLELASSGVYGPLTLLDLGAERVDVDPMLVWGASFFIRADLVSTLGGFHPDSMPRELLRFRGDGESGLMRKFQAAGLRAVYEPESIVHHCVPPERMTVEYLRERYFRQGISDSYTSLREAALGGAQSPEALGEAAGPATEPPGIREPLSDRARAILARIRARVSRLKRAGTSDGRQRMRFDAEMRAARDEGWRFHRTEVERDAELRRWVLQPTYIGVSVGDFGGLDQE
jgi:hypothetical protein